MTKFIFVSIFSVEFWYYYFDQYNYSVRYLLSGKILSDTFSRRILYPTCVDPYTLSCIVRLSYPGICFDISLFISLFILSVHF